MPLGQPPTRLKDLPRIPRRVLLTTGAGVCVVVDFSCNNSNSQFVNCTWHNNFGKRGQNVYMYAANMGVYPASYAALPSGFDTDPDAEQSNSVAIAANVQPPSLLTLRATDSSFEGFEAFVPPPPAPVGVPVRARLARLSQCNFARHGF